MATAQQSGNKGALLTAGNLVGCHRHLQTRGVRALNRPYRPLARAFEQVLNKLCLEDCGTQLKQQGRPITLKAQ